MGVIRKTKSVDLLLKIFNDNDNAFSVVQLVKKTEKHMNKTTVYRILDRLEEEGIIHSFNDSNGLRWYAKCSNCSKGKHIDTHPHFECSNCGNIECVPVNVSIPEVPDLKIDFMEVVLVGTCKSCSF